MEIESLVKLNLESILGNLFGTSIGKSIKIYSLKSSKLDEYPLPTKTTVREIIKQRNIFLYALVSDPKNICFGIVVAEKSNPFNMWHYIQDEYCNEYMHKYMHVMAKWVLDKHNVKVGGKFTMIAIKTPPVGQYDITPGKLKIHKGTNVYKYGE